MSARQAMNEAGRLMLISQRCHAPSAEHPFHDVYAFEVQPASRQPFVLTQSIGGGHAESGGSASLSSAELRAWPGDWRTHLERAGCSWVIEIIDAAMRGDDQNRAIEQIVARVAKARQTISQDVLRLSAAPPPAAPASSD